MIIFSRFRSDRRPHRQPHKALFCSFIAVALIALSACSGQPQATNSRGTKLTVTTPEAVGDLDSATWGMYRPINSLDPIVAFDYPENTVVATLCEAILRQQPDGSLKPGLATLKYQAPTTITLDLRPEVRFWDGTPVTTADVIFSLQRAADPKAGGYYTEVFDRVSSITATGPNQVTITLKQPDYWLEGELSSLAGVVVEKRYAQAHGDSFGTPAGGIMCTGPYRVQTWKAGGDITVTKNDSYWDTSAQAKAKQITFTGVTDASAMAKGLSSGEIDGAYVQDVVSLPALQRASSLNIYYGASFDSDMFIVTSLAGPLGDVRVRRALSLAFDRKTYIKSAVHGAAQVPRMPTNPGTWGFAHGVFQQAWDSMPELKVDLTKARQLVKEAGADGKTIVIGTSTAIAGVALEADAWRAAAESIGLKVTLANVSANNYFNFFVDEKARANLDALMVTTYGSYADPASLESTYALPNGSQNFSGYNNPQITKLFGEARSEADPEQRAKLDVEAEKLIMDDLPWIPVSAPYVVLVMNKRVTGPPSTFNYMSAPVMAMLGAAG
ncbi:ABC transporter substrate-binding protein [Nocardioides sp. CER19]|uniref:ABC transporter substrate-binding protein n=1 Tax=Nocardioides sp. CER19 TaxID=3038538 RepID=UPI00244871A0|nr:ABC transporter substrate-binding protein [Nocardioides sp. CER19]MDH2416112.1 ABC transporter substrate-binding protein [Nocardioides sp. CER19]